MTFPVLVVFLWLRRRRRDVLSGMDRLSLVTAIFVGDGPHTSAC